MTMTSRERWLAALRMQPVDRLPFWPKIDGAYRLAQASPFDVMETNALHQWIESDRHDWIGGCVREERTNTSVETFNDGLYDTVRYHTPHGSLQQVSRFDAASQADHPVEFPIKTAADLEVMAAWFADVRYEPDPDARVEAIARMAEIGESAVVAAGVGTSAMMQFVQSLAGVENAHFLLADVPKAVEGLFDVIHRNQRRRLEIMLDMCPADLFYMVENTSTTLHSPAQYRQYCFPHLLEYATLARQAGKLMALHMCGHLKALLPDLAQLPVAGFEAFTSPTVGNTTLLDGRRGCPNVCLIGGTNAALWLRPAAEIISRIEQDLSELPHHRGVVISSAGVMPPACKPETIREVCRWVQGYGVRADDVVFLGSTR